MLENLLLTVDEEFMNIVIALNVKFEVVKGIYHLEIPLSQWDD